ncbi:hypothetical protein ACQ4PT_002604 [Festuca glaucescens]
MADHCCAHQEVSSYKENLAEEPKQHLPIDAAASKGRYTRSRAGWLSKERSTPEGLNMEEHGWRFQFPFPEPTGGYNSSSDSDWDTPVIRKRKPLEFELVEVRVISIFFEFGGGCIHYNFKAKQPVGHQLGNAGITNLFFSEVDPRFRNENDVLLCCIVEENDADSVLS